MQNEVSPLSSEELANLSALVEKMTPGPWMPEKSWAAPNDATVHWSIRTVEKMPDTPWSPRYVAWMMGALLNNIGASRIPFRFCGSCQHGYFAHREVAVEVRIDEQVEADVLAIVELRNNAARLLAAIEVLQRKVKLARGEMAARELTDADVRRPFTAEEALSQANYWQDLIDQGRAERDFSLPETLRAYVAGLERIAALEKDVVGESVHETDFTADYLRRRLDVRFLERRTLADGAAPVVGLRVVTVREVAERWGLGHAHDEKIHEITSLLSGDTDLVECGPEQHGVSMLRVAPSGSEVTCTSCRGWRALLAQLRIDAEVGRQVQEQAGEIARLRAREMTEEKTTLAARIASIALTQRERDKGRGDDRFFEVFEVIESAIREAIGARAGAVTAEVGTEANQR